MKSSLSLGRGKSCVFILLRVHNASHYRTYGLVYRAKHRETGIQVAIKKFKESDEDEHVSTTSI